MKRSEHLISLFPCGTVLLCVLTTLTYLPAALASGVMTIDPVSLSHELPLFEQGLPEIKDTFSIDGLIPLFPPVEDSSATANINAPIVITLPKRRHRTSLIESIRLTLVRFFNLAKGVVDAAHQLIYQDQPLARPSAAVGSSGDGGGGDDPHKFNQGIELLPADVPVEMSALPFVSLVDLCLAQKRKLLKILHRKLQWALACGDTNLARILQNRIMLVRADRNFLISLAGTPDATLPLPLLHEWLITDYQEVEAYQPDSVTGACLHQTNDNMADADARISSTGNPKSAPLSKTKNEQSSSENQQSGQRKAATGKTGSVPGSAVPLPRKSDKDRRKDDPEQPPIQASSSLPPGEPEPVDFDHLLHQLGQQGLTSYSAQPTFSVLDAWSDLMPSQNILEDLILAARQNSHLQMHPILGSSVLTVVAELSGGFKPGNDSHLAVLSELLGEDIIVFTALQPGQHVYKLYQRRQQSHTFSGRLDDHPAIHRQATAFLAYSRDKGFLRLYRNSNPSTALATQPVRLLPDLLADMPVISSIGGSYDASGLWLPPSQSAPLPLPVEAEPIFAASNAELAKYYLLKQEEDSEQAFKERISRLFMGKLTKADQHLLDNATLTLARSGLIRFSPEDTHRFFCTKTLMEFIEAFWKENRLPLKQLAGIMAGSLDSRLDKQLGDSFDARWNYQLGDVDATGFEPFFINIALPAMTILIETQKELLAALVATVNETRTGKVVIYGGMALRTHLVQQAFNNDLDAALLGGIPSVNDIDLFVENIPTLDNIVSGFTARVQDQYSNLTVESMSVTTGVSGLTTRKIKIRWHDSRVFTIDLNHQFGKSRDDFNQSELMALELNSAAALYLPTLNLEVILHHLVEDSRVVRQSDDNERRRNKASWSLKVLIANNCRVRQQLESTMGTVEYLKLLEEVFGESVPNELLPTCQLSIEERHESPVAEPEMTDQEISPDISSPIDTPSQHLATPEPTLTHEDEESDQHDEKERSPSTEPSPVPQATKSEKKSKHQLKKKQKRKRTGKHVRKSKTKVTPNKPERLPDIIGAPTTPIPVGDLSAAEPASEEPAIQPLPLNTLPETLSGATETSGAEKEQQQEKPQDPPKTLAASTERPDTTNKQRVSMSERIAEKKAELEQLSSPGTSSGSAVAAETVPVSKPSSLGAAFKRLDSLVGELEWLPDDPDPEEDDWLIQNMLPSEQGKLRLWEALHLAQLNIVDGKLQVPVPFPESSAYRRLVLTEMLGNPVATFILALHGLEKYPSESAYHEARLRLSALRYYPALLHCTEKMTNPADKGFDPKGLVRLYQLYAENKPFRLPLDIVGAAVPGARTLAIAHAMEIMTRKAVTENEREEAASWLLAVLEQSSEKEPLQPGVLGIIIALGLDSYLNSYLPEDWNSDCASGQEVFRWVCSWTTSGVPPVYLPDYAARAAESLLSPDGKLLEGSPLEQALFALNDPDWFLLVMYSGPLMVNRELWEQLLSRVKVLSEETQVDDYWQWKQDYLVSHIALHYPESSIAFLELTSEDRVDKRIQIASLAERAVAARSAGNPYYSVLATIKQRWPELAEAHLWEEGTEHGEVILRPGQIDLSLASTGLTSQESSLKDMMIPGHPGNELLGQKLLFHALSQARARVKGRRGSRVITVSPMALCSEAVSDSLEAAAGLGNAEASLLLHLSQNPALAERRPLDLKTAAWYLPQARKMAIRLMLDSASTAYDPYGLLAMYQSAARNPRPSEARTYQVPSALPPSHTEDLYSAYLEEWSTAKTNADKQKACKHLLKIKEIKNKTAGLGHYGIILLYLTDQMSCLPDKLRKKIDYLLNNPPDGQTFHALLLQAIHPAAKPEYALPRVSAITGAPLTISALHEQHGKRVTITSLKVPALARKLALSESDMKVFASELAQLEDNKRAVPGQGVQLLSWILYTDRFLFNSKLAKKLAREIYKIHSELGLVAFRLVARINPDEYPGFIMGYVLDHNRKLESRELEPDELFTAELIKHLILAEQELPAERKGVFTRALMFIEGSKVAITRQLVRRTKKEVARATEAGNPVIFHPADPLPEVSLEDQAIEYLQEIFAAARGQEQDNLPQEALELADMLVALRHPVGQFLKSLDYWQKHHELSPEVIFEMLYPAAMSYLPALYLLLEATKSTHPSYLELERARRFFSLLHYHTVTSVELEHISLDLLDYQYSALHSQLLKAKTTSPDKLFFDATVGEYANSHLQNQIQSLAFLQCFHEWLQAHHQGDIEKKEASQQTLQSFMEYFQQQQYRLNRQETFFSQLMAPGNITREELERVFNLDDLLMIFASQLNLAGHKDQEGAAADNLIGTLLQQNKTISDYELGRSLAWMPLVHQRYPLLEVIAGRLEQRGRPEAAIELYTGAMDWQLQEDPESFQAMVRGDYLQFLIRHAEQFPDKLKHTLHWYVHSMDRLLPDGSFSASVISEEISLLSTMIHGVVPEPLGSELMDIVRSLEQQRQH